MAEADSNSGQANMAIPSARFRRLAVYCGSASPDNPVFIETARQVGRHLAAQGIGVVYGGGRLGLMGALADAALEAGGAVTGIIPEALTRAEVTHKGCTDLRVVRDMHERKRAFTELSDGFITLPGGVGTMDELWEAMSWAQIGYHNNPVGLLNVDGYYDGLLEFYRHMSHCGFVRAQHSNILISADDLDSLLQLMASYQPHETVMTMKSGDL